jgi:hypothetical protein
MDVLADPLIAIISVVALGLIVFFVLYVLVRKLSRTDGPERNWRAIITASAGGLLAAISACIVVSYYVFRLEPLSGDIPPFTLTPTPTPMPTLTLTPTPTKPLEIAEETTITDKDVLAQLEVEYPVSLRPNESANIFLEIYIPPELASIEPEVFTRILIPPDEPYRLREFKTHYSVILASRVMRVELSSQAFQIEDIYPATQEVDIDTGNKSTIWSWNIVAPGSMGRHELTCKVYRGEDEVPGWVGSIEIEVAETTPTPTDTPVPTATPAPTATHTPTPVPPTATPTPTPTPVPFLQTPAGTTLIGAGGTIIAALITGLISFYVARDSFPVIGTKARYRKRLEVLENNLARLREQEAQYGLDVPTKLANEIEETKKQIAETEAKLAEM